MKNIALALCISALASLGYAADSPDRIYAEPVGSNQLDTSHTIDNVALLMNNMEDRVGARAKLCMTLSDLPCERMIFNFPQLHLDKDKNLILLGDKPVAQLHRHGMRVVVAKNYRLGYEIASNQVDSGFDKNKGRTLRLYLEPKSNEGLR